ncbi:MAG: DUF4159 domain-containing protein [Candidatus Hydrogenedentota bacterium]
MLLSLSFFPLSCFLLLLDIIRVTMFFRGGGAMDRRDYLKLLFSFICANFIPYKIKAEALAEVFTFSQIKYNKGDWNPDPSAALNLLKRVESFTSVLTDKRFDNYRNVVDITKDNIFEYPFLYITGHYEFEEFSNDVIHRLRVFLSNGGLLVCDDCAGTSGMGFDKSIRNLIKSIFPDKSLLPLPYDHTIFQTYFLIQDFRIGRRLITRSVEGVDIGDLTPVLYFRNDLGCAWEMENNRWVHNCVPYGELQRALAFKMGVNIVMYALCANYKKDEIHIPEIMRKRGRR